MARKRLVVRPGDRTRLRALEAKLDSVSDTITKRPLDEKLENAIAEAKEDEKLYSSWAEICGPRL